jgi:hypothetical protein
MRTGHQPRRERERNDRKSLRDRGHCHVVVERRTSVCAEFGSEARAFTAALPYLSGRGDTRFRSNTTTVSFSTSR